MTPPRIRSHPGSGLDEGTPDELRVVLHMDGAPGPDRSERRVVEATCTARWVDAWRYSRDGPPSDVPTTWRRNSDQEQALGWLSISSSVVEWGTARHLVYGVNGVRGPDNYWAKGSPLLQSLGPEEEPDSQLSDQALRTVLACAGPLLISSVEGVADGVPAFWEENCVVLDWTAGAALLGRLARERGESLPVGRHQVTDETGYYTSAVQDLLPAFATYVHAVHAAEGAYEPLLAVRARVIQVLLARDQLARLLGQLDQLASFRVTDALDRVLVFSLAALDELAHSVHDACDLDVKPTNERKWHTKAFRKALAQRDHTKDLAELWRSDGPHWSSNVVLRFLRNYIHGTGFSPSSFGNFAALNDDYPLSAPVRFRPRDLEKALETSARGGWGLILDEDRLQIDPESLCEKVVYDTLKTLDATMAAASASISPLHTIGSAQPPHDPPSWILQPNWGDLSQGDYSAAFGLGRLAQELWVDQDQRAK